jgi:peptide deformylase
MFKGVFVMGLVDLTKDNILQAARHADTLFQAPKCMEVGVSAFYIGVAWDMFLYKDELFINCWYEGIGKRFDSVESCLMTRGYYSVLRFREVKVKGRKLVGSNLIYIDYTFHEDEAFHIQHLIDHSHRTLISSGTKVKKPEEAL